LKIQKNDNEKKEKMKRICSKCGKKRDAEDEFYSTRSDCVYCRREQMRLYKQNKRPKKQLSKSIKIPKSELVYLAGFFDGEGSIGITKSLVLQITVSNTRRVALDIYKQYFGGSITETKRSGNHNDIFVWKIDAKKAELFILTIKPFLKQKSVQAQLALEFRKLFKYPYVLPRGNTQLRKADNEKASQVVKLRTGYYKEMAILNKRGRT
jgi:hypothetical protein